MDRPATAWLKTLPLFGGLTDEGLGEFASRAERVEVRAGEVLYREDERADHLFIVDEGEVSVLKGRGRELTRLSRGDMFGEMSFVDMQPRSATVRVEKDAVLWRFPYNSLHGVYRSDPKAYMLVVMNIARELSRRLRRADEVICGL